jgi:pimeloyl-ACP methyl ester carboxylesterase
MGVAGQRASPSAALAFEAGSDPITFGCRTCSFDRCHPTIVWKLPMPYRSIPGGSSRYALVAFDQEGHESTKDPDGLAGCFSRRLISDFAQDTVTDVFLISHGWMGDMPAAIDEYDHWFGAQVASTADQERMARRRPGFKPLRIGVHWPSKPWGNEEFGGAAAAYSLPDDMVELYVARLGDRRGLREAVTTVVRAAAEQPDAQQMPPAAAAAYRDINAMLAELGTDGEGAAPGSDREPFDPRAHFAVAQEEASFGLGDSLGVILAPLRQLSFWKMKQRACLVGETGMMELLAALQQAAGSRDVRFHLMGHSFGCIVVSAMLCGAPAHPSLAKPVASLALVQGALSLWSYCEKIPVVPGRSGYFRSLITDKKVTGPILTTRSFFDTANRCFYPLGAGIADQVEFGPAELPRYGALGTYGAQGLTRDGNDLPMRSATDDYRFAAGGIYNLQASEFIRNGGGAAGAHNDIAGPEVAHAIWEASLPAA